MMRILSWLILFVAHYFISHSSLADVGVHFYKSPNSLFSSGQTHVDNLSKTILKQEFLYSFLVENNNKKIWVPARVAAIDLFMAEKVIYQGTPYLLKDTHDSWALIERTSDQHKTWAALSDLKPQNDDLGAAITLISTSLKSKPSWSSETIISLVANTRLFILDFADSWAKVKFESGQSIVGYVDLNNLLLKADFANEILLQNGKWKMVKHRELDHIVTNDEDRIALSKIKAYRTDTRKLITIKPMYEQNIVLRQSFHILEVNAKTWFQSELPGHGLVYWTKPEKLDNKKDQEIYFSYKDLIKNEITSVNWNPANPKQGIVSAQGIYYTLDGEHWRKIPQFRNENHPVAIFPDGTWVVGGLRSMDPEKKFKPYLRWDYLTKVIQGETKKSPKSLKITNVQYTPQNRIQLTLDSGSKKIILATKSNEEVITDWQLLR